MRASRAIVARADALAEELARHGAEGCEIGFVLGSGLGAFAASLESPLVIPAAVLSDLPQSRVPGHAGRVVIGTVAGVRVIVQEGRVHLYEGWSAHDVTRAVRSFARLGVKGIVLTNAAGSLHPEWPPGSFMRLIDHLNLQGRPALLSEEGGLAEIYDPDLGQALDGSARSIKIELRRGVYAGLLGPAYETAAEVSMLRGLGADALGMSTVAEASVARAEGLRVAAISCLTNHAAGITQERLQHEDVVAVARSASEDLARMLVLAVPELARQLEIQP